MKSSWVRVVINNDDYHYYHHFSFLRLRVTQKALTLLF